MSLSPDDRELLDRAIEVRANAFAPMSGYLVGAALRAEDGSVQRVKKRSEYLYPVEQ